MNGTGNMRRFDEEATRKNEKRGEPASNPNLHRIANSGHVKAIVSSLQDVSNSNTRSPSSTPIMTRRIPSLMNCQRQTSLDQHFIQQCNTPNQQQQQQQQQQYHHSYDYHKYDCPPSRSSLSSEYAVLNLKQPTSNYTNIEKKRIMTPKPSPLANGTGAVSSRLRVPSTCSPTPQQHHHFQQRDFVVQMVIF
ncbi:unnamed protein product [Anisakis simplex]|uniref:Uncharacterized protein n=1 Tax=Anisakis simplex TaxID=6269 RepID=A0A3P6U121_ANISI|nr:unnamed protein product [Anisakis simplex]